MREIDAPSPPAPITQLTSHHDLRESRRHGLRTLVELVALAFAVHFLLSRIASVERALVVMGSFSWWLVAPALASEALSYVGSGFTVSSLTKVFQHPVKIWRAVEVVLASYSLSVLWGGQLTYSGATFRWLRFLGVPREGALLTGTVPALLNVSTVGAAALRGTAFLLARGALPDPLTVVAGPALVAATAATLLGFFLARSPERVRRLSHAGARLWSCMHRRDYSPATIDEWVGRLFEAGAALRGRRWVRPLIGDGANVGFDFLALELLFLASGYHANPAVVLAGYGPPLLVAKLTPLPGGVGLIEGGMLAIYSSVGVPAAESVVVIITYRLISFWIPVLIGFTLVPLLNRVEATSARP